MAVVQALSYCRVSSGLRTVTTFTKSNPDKRLGVKPVGHEMVTTAVRSVSKRLPIGLYVTSKAINGQEMFIKSVIVVLVNVTIFFTADHL